MTISAFLLSDTSVSGHPGCVTVMQVIRRELAARNVSVAGTWPVALDRKWGLDLLPSLARSSVVVVNGEGTIHHTDQRWAARQLIESARYLKRRWASKVFLINATLEAVAPEDEGYLHDFDQVFVRENKSLKYLQSLGIAGAVMVPDLSLLSRHEGPAMRSEQTVVTDSVLPQISARLAAYAKRASLPFQPMQPSRPVSYLRWAIGSRSLDENALAYYRLLAGSSGVVTGRFHAALFCIHARTPFLAVASNTSKIQQALLDATGRTDRIVTAEALDGDRLDIPPFSAEEMSGIDAYISASETGAGRMFDRIAQPANE